MSTQRRSQAQECGLGTTLGHVNWRSITVVIEGEWGEHCVCVFSCCHAQCTLVIGSVLQEKMEQEQPLGDS